MNWVVVGQGAMGLLWYHHLSQALNVNNNPDDTNNKLSLLASKRHDFTNNHYQFTSLNKQVTNGVVHYAQPKQLQAADNIMLCLKSYQIAEVMTQIAKSLKVGANIILAHNGMGTVEQLPQTLIDNHTIYALLSTHGCLRTASLNITHTGSGESNIGLISGKQDSLKEQLLTSTLNKALPTVSFETNITEKQWLKLAVNCVINPITALYNIDNGLVNDLGFTKQTQVLLAEISAVASTQGIMLIASELQKTVQQVAQATAKNCSSMRCDVLEKRQTEVDYINGYIHHLGEKHNIATPENNRMWQAVKKLESNF